MSKSWLNSAAKQIGKFAFACNTNDIELGEKENGPKSGACKYRFVVPTPWRLPSRFYFSGGGRGLLRLLFGAQSGQFGSHRRAQIRMSPRQA